MLELLVNAVLILLVTWGSVPPQANIRIDTPGQHTVDDVIS